MSRSSVGFKTLAGATLLSCPVVAGLIGRPAGIFVLFAIGFFVLKMITGRRLWAQTIAERGPQVIPPMIAATIVVQTILAAGLFFVGRGLGKVVGHRFPSTTLEALDGILVACCLAISLAAFELARRK